MGVDPTGMTTEGNGITQAVGGAEEEFNNQKKNKSHTGERLINLLTLRGFRTDDQLAAETAIARGSGESIGKIGDNGQFIPTASGASSGTKSTPPRNGQSYHAIADPTPLNLTGPIGGQCYDFIKFMEPKLPQSSKLGMGLNVMSDINNIGMGTIIAISMDRRTYPKGNNPKHIASF